MKHMAAVFLLAASVVIGLGAVLPGQALARSRSGEENWDGADVWIADWRNQTFRDDKKPAARAESVELVTAKNDIEPYQINVRSARDGQINGVAFSALTSENGVIGTENESYSFVDYVRPVSNSRYSDAADPTAVADGDGVKWVDISNPIRKVTDKTAVAFPEILTKAPTRKVKAGMTQTIWVKVSVPKNAAAGTYTGAVQVKTTWGDYDFPVKLEVRNVTIPDTNSPDAFDLEIWSQLVGNMDTGVDVIEGAYGVTVDSPQWWEVMGKFADLMKENRLNVMMVNQTDLLLYGSKTAVDAKGNVTFDWSFFNKFLDFFRKRGGIKEFSGAPLAKYRSNPKNYNNDKPGEEINDYTTACVECIVRDPDTGHPVKKLVTPDVDKFGEEGEEACFGYVEQYAGSLEADLKAQGLDGMFSHHIIDEPGKRQQAALYPILEGLLKKHCPGMRTGDAFTAWTAEEQSKHGERFAVMEYSLDELPDKVEAFMKPGDELWVYTSSVPLKDNYLNRTIDQPVWFPEMMAWFCYKHGATGYLHWGLNQWNTWTKDYLPFPDYPQAKMWDNVLGDASCVYPDKKNLDVKSSIRVEALREMSQLSSLILKAKERHPKEVNQILDEMLRSGKDYEMDTSKIQAARLRILSLASE